MRILKLNRNNDFKRAYSKGRYVVHPILISYVVKNRAGRCRLGVTTSKKVGNAVRRNRARRVIVAAFQQVEPLLKGNWDIVLVARSATAGVKSTDVLPVLQWQLKKLGVLEE
ncbi:MAG: ribonuclease P protein component [Oscillospiraceae bacterium]|nr:ribonuclease P protein component [Oscillospiraceae bacterium]